MSERGPHWGVAGTKISYATEEKADAAARRRGLYKAYACRAGGTTHWHLTRHGWAQPKSRYTRIEHDRRRYELAKLELGLRAAGVLHAENEGSRHRRRRVVAGNAARAAKRREREAA